MPNSFETDDDDDYDYDEPSSSEGLRAHAKSLEKRMKALIKENGSLRTTNRKSTISDMIAAKGLNPLIAGIIPSDVTDSAELTAWFDQFGSLFSLPTESVPDPVVTPSTPTNIDPAVLLELSSQSASESSGSPSGAGAIEALLANASSQDEVREIINRHSNLRH